MAIVLPFLFILLAGMLAAYHRWRLATWVSLSAVLLVACALLGANGAATLTAAVLLALVAVPLLVPAIRKALVTAPLLKFYTRILPPLSDTERTALESGTVGFEGELFSGKPDWQQLLSQPKPQL
ncbi:MAG TPA: acyl-CoA dehydrogenase, partial [Luteimonas sp.]|nr:acyl-CoA dehydrogenase [Luteimonas sp.]